MINIPYVDTINKTKWITPKIKFRTTTIDWTKVSVDDLLWPDLIENEFTTESIEKENIDFHGDYENIDWKINEEYYELFYNNKLIWKWDFIIEWESILIKYVEKFTKEKWFWTYMFKDFFWKLKHKQIQKIKTEIHSPEVIKIYENLENDWIIQNTEKWYIIV